MTLAGLDSRRSIAISLVDRVSSVIDSMTMSAPFSRASLVGFSTTEVYSGPGADIVMESVALIYLNEGNRLFATTIGAYSGS